MGKVADFELYATNFLFTKNVKIDHLFNINTYLGISPQQYNVQKQKSLSSTRVYDNNPCKKTKSIYQVSCFPLEAASSPEPPACLLFGKSNMIALVVSLKNRIYFVDGSSRQ